MTYNYLKESKQTLNILLYHLKKLMKLKTKIYKINRNYFGINRDIENLIHNSRIHLTESFKWLDKAYYQLKNDISKKQKINDIIKSKVKQKWIKKQKIFIKNIILKKIFQKHLTEIQENFMLKQKEDNQQILGFGQFGNYYKEKVN